MTTIFNIRPGVMSDVSDLMDWKDKVLEKHNRTCVNCERTDRVAACFVVPPEAGGKLRTANGVVVCRECRIAVEGARALPQRIENKTPINFLISSRLHSTVHSYVRNGSRFGNVSSLLRAMICSFITQPELYQDLEQWQDAGSEVKVNGWVDGAQYEIFKVMCKDRGVNYTDVFKSLLLVAVQGYEVDEKH